MNIKINVKPEYIFLFLGLIYGLAFLLVVPPFQAPDEYEHFYKAYSISEGNLIPEKVGNRAGVYLPKDVYNTTKFIHQEWKLFVKKKNKMDMPFLFENPIKNDDKKAFVSFSWAAVITYSPIPYLMASLSIAVGKLFNLSPLALMYIARFANLILWVFLIYFSIKITPVFKWGFLAIALMPMTLFLSASVSADSLTIGLSFVAIALFLRYSLDDEIKKINFRNILPVYLIILALSLTKLPYFLLIFLFFLIPASKFGNKRNRFATFAFMLLIAFIIIGLWALMTKGLYMPGRGVSMYKQFLFISQRPLLFLQMIWKTSRITSIKFLVLTVGNWGVLNSPLPMLIYYANIFLLSFLALFDKNGIKINFRRKSVVIGTFLIVMGSIFLIEYITWTRLGLNVITGVQGRYFIPILPLLFLLFYNNKLKLKEDILKLIITTSIILILSLTILIFLIEYYI